MQRLSFVMLLVGCTGQIEADIPEGISPEEEAARSAWVANAQPVLDVNCASCHGGSRPEVAWFLGAPDVQAQRKSVLMYTRPTANNASIINLGAPSTSEIVKHGAHEGPALSADQASKIIDWIQKEREAATMGNPFPVMLAPSAMMVCTTGAPGDPTCPYNDLPLDEAGAAGAKIQFTMTDVSGAVYLSNLKVVPGPMGVHVEHPIFVSVPAMGMPILDPLDRFETVNLNLPADAPAAMQQLGMGTASFAEFKPTDPIAVYFVAVSAMMP
jgi:mono/diheme cytochrome c family protein